MKENIKYSLRNIIAKSNKKNIDAYLKLLSEESEFIQKKISSEIERFGHDRHYCEDNGIQYAPLDINRLIANRYAIYLTTKEEKLFKKLPSIKSHYSENNETDIVASNQFSPIFQTSFQ